MKDNPRTTKTRQGDAPISDHSTSNRKKAHLRPYAPKIFPNPRNPERCPVELYKLFASHRPDNMCHPESPFYLGIRQNISSNVWYRSQPMGTDTLGSIIKNMTKAAGLQGKFSNHSVRRTMCTDLLNSGVHPHFVAQLSGHKSTDSLLNYHVASLAQQKAMCSVLQNRQNIPPQPSLDTSTPNPCLQNAIALPNPTPSTSTMSTQVLTQQKQQNMLEGMFSNAVFHGPVHITFN